MHISHLITIAFFILLPAFAWVDDGVNTNTKKNIIFIVSDGMGPSSLSLARSFRQERDDLEVDDVLSFEKLLVGTIRTRSNSSLITDSAAAGTAFSCGVKTYNGAIGVNADEEPVGTVLEALKLKGYKTGLVVTTKITDATPAVFSAHVAKRSLEGVIAEQQLGDSPFGQVVDLMIGGGRANFYSTEGGSRTDGRNLIEEAQGKGWTYVGDKSSFDQLDGGNNVSLPLLGLLADKDIPYDIDRDNNEHPSLLEQTKVALTALSKATQDSDQGFFVLIESSRIDHAGHDNDAAAHVREVLAYHDMFEEVIKFVDNADVETTVIATSDHETGGLAPARQVTKGYPEYLWYPQVLVNATHSGEFLTKKILKFAADETDSAKITDFIESEIMAGDLGIVDYTDEEIAEVLDLAKEKDSEELTYALNDYVSQRSQTGWTTHAHSAADVNVYAYTNSKAMREKILSNEPNVGLMGTHENTEIATFIASISGSNLTEVTERLRRTKRSDVESTNWEDQKHVNI